MKTFNYQNELKQLIENKQLVEVNIQGLPTFVVAYILATNPEYLTLGVVSSSATLTGVTIVKASDIDSISVESIYLSELVKEIKEDSIYSQIMEVVREINEFTFDGFAESLENSKTLVEITTYNEDNFAGRIAGHNTEILILDEYSTESDKRIKRTFFNRETIARLSLGVAWVKTIARSLADKNI